MPSVVGPIKITSVSSGAVVNFGDTLYISPKVATKTNGGSGAFNTGDFIITMNGINLTNDFDQDVSDSNVTANN
jgi:spore germination protein PF